MTLRLHTWIDDAGHFSSAEGLPEVISTYTEFASVRRKRDKGFYWLDVVEPDDDELNYLFEHPDKVLSTLVSSTGRDAMLSELPISRLALHRDVDLLFAYARIFPNTTAADSYDSCAVVLCDTGFILTVRASRRQEFETLLMKQLENIKGCSYSSSVLAIFMESFVFQFEYALEALRAVVVTVSEPNVDRQQVRDLCRAWLIKSNDLLHQLGQLEPIVAHLAFKHRPSNIVFKTAAWSYVIEQTKLMHRSIESQAQFLKLILDTAVSDSLHDLEASQAKYLKSLDTLAEQNEIEKRKARFFEGVLTFLVVASTLVGWWGRTAATQAQLAPLWLTDAIFYWLLGILAVVLIFKDWLLILGDWVGSTYRKFGDRRSVKAVGQRSANENGFSKVPDTSSVGQ